MKHRTLPVVTAFAAAALLLTACGGGEDAPKDNGRTEGAEAGAPKKKESPAASPPDSAGRPFVELPSDVKNVFEDWKTGDPIEDAALADTTRRINATDAAITSTATKSETISFYTKGEALFEAEDRIQLYKKKDLSVTGTTRYSMSEVAKLDNSTVSLIYCADESKAYNKDRNTGKVNRLVADDQAYVLFNTRLDVTKQGVWQTTEISSERGHEKCLP